MLRLMKIFEVLWLCSQPDCPDHGHHQGYIRPAYGNYIYITLFTAAVALFMYRFKKRNRLYLEEREKEHIR